MFRVVHEYDVNLSTVFVAAAWVAAIILGLNDDLHTQLQRLIRGDASVLRYSGTILSSMQLTHLLPSEVQRSFLPILNTWSPLESACFPEVPGNEDT